MNAVSKRVTSLRKPMSRFRFLLNPDFLRLANKIICDHGRGPLTIGDPRFLEPAEPPIATPLSMTKKKVVRNFGRENGNFS